jgi:uncharacterized integral membrane protein (TIGR00698 family)
VPPERAHPLARFLLPLLAAACLWPAVGAGEGLLAGLSLGLLLGNPFPAQTRRLASPLLSLSLVGLGAGMDLRAVARAGASGALYTALGIGAALLLGALLSRLLGVPRVLAALLSVGTAICGGSAIAAAAAVLRPKDHETSVALATVFLLNAVALFVFPPLGHLAHLSDGQFGLWAALAIHDTSSVVAAALHWGGGAATVATTVKLARALWIVPVSFALGAWNRRYQEAPEGQAAKPKRPWFILGFLAAAALTTYVPELRPLGLLAAAGARQLLVLVLFLVGAGLTRGALRAVGVRPLLFGVLLWVAMAGASLAGIALFA